MSRVVLRLSVAAVGAVVLAIGACDDSSSTSGGGIRLDGGGTHVPGLTLPDAALADSSVPDSGAADSAIADSSVVDAGFDASFDASDAAITLEPPKTNLEVWVRADLGVTLNGGKVSAWNDQSGKNHHFSQTDPTKQPTLASNDAGAVTGLTFLGVEHLVADTTQLFPTNDAPLAIAVVFTTTDPSTQKFLFNYGNGGGGNQNLELGYATSDQSAGNFGLHRGASQGTTTAPGQIATGTVYRSIVSIAGTGAPPTNIDIRLNGVAQAAQNGGAGWLAAGSYVTTAAPMEIGARVDGNFSAPDYATHLAAAGDAHHVGMISEVLVYKGGLVTGDLAKLEAYLASR